ncbi:phage terminase small subunit P27 family [Belliella pelovolcani]|uniref:Phage terminase, small subunit, putative, P27 family n=1 Tax=Belliella pelovolcani TaxID=529505 RepID=A0A1N7MRH4_9BACT|nr:phage terminase small subunit P27 family [Belliella pelovolcani]SIS88734.1 phage terminase, small subunit, putative, P27 family [Belliella pelovolcani]
MGRPTIPDEIKAKKGTLKPNRIKKNQPIVEKITFDEIKVPSYLNIYGKKFYLKFSELMINKGVLSNFDLESLGLLSSEYGKYIEAQLKLKKEGYTTIGTNKNGSQYEMVSPYINIASTAFKNYNSLISKFGLTPSDRSKLTVQYNEEITDEKTLDNF